MSNKKYHNPGGPLRNPKIADCVARIERNGISLADLRHNFELGYKQGKEEGIAWGYDAAYGSLMIALHRVYGFGRDRLSRLAMATAEVQIECMSNDEAYRKLVAETGLSLLEMREIVENGGF